jgi:hypothetical protein
MSPGSLALAGATRYLRGRRTRPRRRARLSFFGRLTQWLECHPHTVEVIGSNPMPPIRLTTISDELKALYAFWCSPLKRWDNASFVLSIGYASRVVSLCLNRFLRPVVRDRSFHSASILRKSLGSWKTSRCSQSGKSTGRPPSRLGWRNCVRRSPSCAPKWRSYGARTSNSGSRPAIGALNILLPNSGSPSWNRKLPNFAARIASSKINSSAASRKRRRRPIAPINWTIPTILRSRNPAVSGPAGLDPKGEIIAICPCARISGKYPNRSVSARPAVCR